MTEEVFYGIKLSDNHRFEPTVNLFWFNFDGKCQKISNGYKTMQIGKNINGVKKQT